MNREGAVYNRYLATIAYREYAINGKENGDDEWSRYRWTLRAY